MNRYIQNTYGKGQIIMTFILSLIFVSIGNSQTCPNIAQGSYNAAFTQNTDPIVGQRFTATCTGVIQDIRFATANFTTAGTGSLQLYHVVNGAAGSPISTASYYINAHFNVLTVTLPTPVMVTSGHMYMFLLVKGSENTQWLVSDANPYGNGEAVASSTNNTATVSTIPTADLLFQVTYQAVLPVEFMDFQANRQKEGNQIHWTTANELNNAGFTIQRSNQIAIEGDTNWKDVGFVKGKGTSDQIHTYTFYDKNPIIGKQYYRLRQEDLDGTISYSDVVAVYFEKEDAPLTVYPNPSQGIVHLPSLKKGDVVRVLNQQGQLIGTQVLDNHAQINLLGLPTGLYYLQVHKENKMRIAKVFLKTE